MNWKHKTAQERLLEQDFIPLDTYRFIKNKRISIFGLTPLDLSNYGKIE